MISLLDFLAGRGLQVLSLFFQSLPLETALNTGRVLGSLVFWFSKRRHVAYADLKAALGPSFHEKERWRVIREHYAHLGQMLVEVLRFPKLDRAKAEKKIRIHPPDALAKVLRENPGGIFLTAHFGNWEMIQVLPPRVYGYPLHVLARSQKFPKLNQFLNDLRQSLGTKVITRGAGIRDLLRSLRRKEWVALLGDQDAGRDGGIILPFLGRKTTVPTGPFEFAAKTGTVVVPAFVTRSASGHDFYVGQPLHCRPDSQEDIEAGARAYLSLSEDFIRRYPSQWLWETKRWKYSWTKRLLILSDGKAGHVKQSQSLANQIRSIETQYGRRGMEYPTQTIQIRFRSSLRRILFPYFAFLLVPWIQGRLRFLKFFFTPETAKAVEEASADFVISAGSSLVPLNLCIARDSRAKSVILMKPPFPFNLFHFDLAVVPAHDRGLVPDEAFRTLLAPSTADPALLERDAQKLRPHLRDISRLEFALFIGGDTRRFKMKLADIQTLFETLGRLSAPGDYLVTTSRRTSDEIVDYLKSKVRPHAACQMLVIANEDNRPEVVGGMMALAEILVVTEDSISMISEAVRSGKKVMVLCFEGKGLPTKHRRFREILAKESAIVTATPETLEEKILQFKDQPPVPVLQTETEALKKRLQAIL